MRTCGRGEVALVDTTVWVTHALMRTLYPRTHGGEAAVGADPRPSGGDGGVRMRDGGEGGTADVVMRVGDDERVLPCAEADGVGAAVALPTEEGVRVAWPVAHAAGRRGGRSSERGRGGGRGRGGEERGGPSRQRRVNSQNIRWTAVARNAYMQRQNQFGRGEGGGVT